jgi:hypothetical protein
MRRIINPVMIPLWLIAALLAIPAHAEESTPSSLDLEMPFVAMGQQGFSFPQKEPDGTYLFMGQRFTDYVITSFFYEGWSVANEYYVYFHNSNPLTVTWSSGITMFGLNFGSTSGVRLYRDGAAMDLGIVTNDWVNMDQHMTFLYSTADILDRDGSVLIPANVYPPPPEDEPDETLEEAIHAIRDAMPYLIIAVSLGVGAVIALAVIQELRKW